MDPLTERYNNPGALEYKPWMSEYGATLGPNGRFAAFTSPDEGYRAMNRVLDTYQSKHGLNTVEGIINRWAPSGTDNNSTGTYVASVSHALGVDPRQPLGPEHRQNLMRAMASYEAGRPQSGPSAGPPPMFPPTAAIDPDSELAKLYGGYGRDPSAIPTSSPPMPAGPMPPPQQPPQMPPQPQPPSAWGTFGNVVGGLARGAQGILTSPLFQAGAALVNAGAQGKNVGAGLLAANDASTKASASLLQQDAAAREMQSRQMRAQMWQGLSSGNIPAWARTLPAGTLDLAKALGPDAGSQLVVDLVKRTQEQYLQRAQLEETKRMNTANIANMEAQRRIQEQQSRNQTPEMRAAQAAQYGLKPGTPEYNQFVLTGALPAKVGPDSTARRAIYEAQDAMPNLQGAIETLNEAKGLVDKAYHGYGSQTRSAWNQGMPGFVPNVFSNAETSAATVRLNQIMSEQAISAMSQALKGATTDREMAQFKAIMADPNVSPQVKKQAIDTLIQRAQRQQKVYIDRIKELGGTVPDFATGQKSAPLARPRAINQQTHEVLEWDGNAWVPARPPAP